MVTRICLDTGPLTLHLTKDEPEEIKNLMKAIKEKKIEAHVITPLLVEVYNHLCIAKGKIFAETSLSSLQRHYPLKKIPITNDLLLKAGSLKCQYRRTLSYFDSLAIAHALNEKLVFHTTEKTFPKILNLKVHTYDY